MASTPLQRICIQRVQDLEDIAIATTDIAADVADLETSFAHFALDPEQADQIRQDLEVAMGTVLAKSIIKDFSQPQPVTANELEKQRAADPWRALATDLSSRAVFAPDKRHPRSAELAQAHPTLRDLIGAEAYLTGQRDQQGRELFRFRPTTRQDRA